MDNKLIPFLVILLIIASFLAGSFWTRMRYLESKKEEIAQLTPTPTPEMLGEKEPEYPKTIGNFLALEREVCFEDEKPIVYFFGHSGCPHCKWQEPVIKKVASKFGDLIAFHNNMDSQEDIDILEEYQEVNPGYVPFLVLGCKYVRVGSGELLGEEEETRALTAIICKLTDEKSEEVCEPLKDLTDSVLW